MNYEEALEKMQQLTKFGVNFGLERIRRLLELVGNPEKSLRIIHLGGTNGKGSTGVILAAILQQAGYRVGIFTSPHLHSYTERIKINGEEISRVDFAGLLAELVPRFREMVGDGYEHPTEFEVNTAMALIYFYRQQVDLAIVEVGLGGAIDSTNVVNPLAAVITNVTMEHMDYLGETITEIAGVKAGIIKEKRPVITAVDDPTVLEVIKDRCTLLDAPLYQVQDLTKVGLRGISLTGQTFDARLGEMEFIGLELSLVGDHQLINSATALLTIKVLNDHYGIAVMPEHVKAGMKKVVWPGRLELLRNKPTVLIDGAHNFAGIVALAEAVKKYYKYEKFILVMGMLADKEREKAVGLIGPLAESIIVTRPNSPRAGNWQELACYAAKYCSKVEAVADIREAIRKGLSQAGVDDLVCITGSLYMVAEARDYLLNSNK